MLCDILIHNFYMRCDVKLTVPKLLGNIGSGNGFLPVLCRAITRTNANLLSIGHQGTNFSEIFIQIQTFPAKKMQLKMASAKWRPFCSGLIVFAITLLDTGISSVKRQVIENHYSSVTACKPLAQLLLGRTSVDILWISEWVLVRIFNTGTCKILMVFIGAKLSAVAKKLAI